MNTLSPGNAVSRPEIVPSGSRRTAGRLLFHIVGAVAQFEVEILRSRIEMGMAEARRKGRHIGRPPLKRFSEAELEQIRADRGNARSSIRQVAIQQFTAQYTKD